jgi:hypothetical protein
MRHFSVLLMSAAGALYSKKTDHPLAPESSLRQQASIRRVLTVLLNDGPEHKARPHIRQLEGALLQRTAGPYIWLTQPGSDNGTEPTT